MYKDGRMRKLYDIQKSQTQALLISKNCAITDPNIQNIYLCKHWEFLTNYRNFINWKKRTVLFALCKLA